MSSELIEKARALPLAERVALANLLIESAEAEGYEAEPAGEPIQELDLIAEEVRKNPSMAIPWEQVKADSPLRRLNK